MIKMAGTLQALGELRLEDIPPETAQRASAVLSLADGRQVVITGLTRDECRKISGDFGEPMTLRLEGLPC